MSLPFFTIVIPAKGRPSYLNDAIQSVIYQDFHNIQILISNNGADPALRAVASQYSHDNRIKYIEHETTLSMPAHWEKITNEFSGQYLMILTDRSVFKVGTLSYLYEHITHQTEKPNIVCWPWDIYLDDLKVLIPFKSTKDDFNILKSDDEMISISRGSSPLDSKLPRGLNSCVSNKLIKSLRIKYGSVFRAISPDLTFAYLCLMNSKEFTYINRPLFISQGLKVSNGGSALIGDSSHYFKLLGLSEPFKHVPVRYFLFYSCLNEDLLSISDLCSRHDLIMLWNKQKYYLDCLAEVDEKKAAGLLEIKHIEEMQHHIMHALESESTALQNEIKSRISNKNVIKMKFFYKLKVFLAANPNINKFLILLRKRKSRTFVSVLKAAGFK